MKNACQHCTWSSPFGHAQIDSLVSESNNFEGLKSRANTIQIGRIIYYVGSIDDLIEMKQKAGRPQDLLDIETLKKIKEQNDN